MIKLDKYILDCMLICCFYLRFMMFHVEHISNIKLNKMLALAEYIVYNDIIKLNFLRRVLLMNRIEEIKKEINELFKSNKMEDGFVYGSYLNFLEEKTKETPYIDSRVNFKGKRKLSKLIEEFKKLTC